MAATATDTIVETINSYQADEAEPDEVLKQFHTNARIRGTKSKDKWEKKAHAKSQLKTDRATYTVSGPFTSTVIKDDELTSLASGVMLFDRNGKVTFKRRRGSGQVTAEARWTAVLKEYTDGWKIMHSHFSLEEGKKVP